VTTVYLDVDTQLDFLCPAGALYVPGAEQIVATIAALNRHAAAHGTPLISTTDSHHENDVEFRDWPSHCIRGTLGQRKPAETLVGEVAVIPFTHSIPAFATAKQYILEKASLHSFTNLNLEGLLQALGADRYVIYGVVTEICVKLAAHELLKRTGKRIEIVKDAVRHLSESDRDQTFADLAAAGAHFIGAAAILG